MKLSCTAFLLFCFSLAAQADTLKLHDGTQMVGRYLGGTQDQIWFERQGQMVTTTEAIPTSAVEALTFGPTTAAPASRPSFLERGFRYFSVFLATAWFPYESSILKVMLSPDPPGKR
jgi:hypothetical protein